MTRILITPRSLTSDPPVELDRLAANGFEPIFSTPGEMPDEAELLRLVPGCVGWLAGVEPVSEAVIEAASELRVISRNGTGVDSLPLELLRRKGIALERAVGANATGVAELAVGLMLSCCRHLPEISKGVAAGGWPRRRGREIEGSTIGIVGMGAIGGKVASVVSALGARVLAMDPARPPLGLLGGAVRYAGLDEVVRNADFLTLHCPQPEDGRPIIHAETLERMKRGAIVINTARAALVDEEAMLEALDQGRISHYATDVFSVEPPKSLALAAHRNVIATSHIGGLTDGSVSRATDAAVENLLKHLVRDHAAA
ncbi:D-3-phosphoglycerate dehydrogenase/hypothetical protein [Palleronia aestuarii]|uniref:D-3-phosphoglycerate dehydrogenase n=1 Tax=Palleronia aestuarii TaxID=568105 RepID=A0A2W7MXE5_9RHOB|nr:phosphoglycerate dehydrogenase [Palleronia aestuarii]PZX12203.1 D-3-phosphoglycerate dehydrogenase/hypothetical protein [Palleronia aestuarii]